MALTETKLYHFHRTGGNGLGYGCGAYMDFYLTQLPIRGNKMQLDGVEFEVVSFNGKKLQMRTYYDNGNSGGDEWLVGKWVLDSEKSLEQLLSEAESRAVERWVKDKLFDMTVGYRGDISISFDEMGGWNKCKKYLLKALSQVSSEEGENGKL